MLPVEVLITNGARPPLKSPMVIKLGYCSNTSAIDGVSGESEESEVSEESELSSFVSVLYSKLSVRKLFSVCFFDSNSV